jgi:hypothetical protein
VPVLYPRYRHSVSAANLWRDCPSAFLWRYGLQRWGKDTLRTYMGKAAEAAYANALLSGLSADQAADDARQRFYSLSEGEDSEHADYSAEIARKFVENTDPAWGKLIVHAPWRPVHCDMIQREISLKPDFVFENALVDTKATLRMPSEPSSSHVRQISAYAREWKLPGVLFYATPKKSSHLTAEPDAAEAAWRGLIRDWRQIEEWDRRFADFDDAARVTPLNTDSFYWDEDQIDEADQLWTKAQERKAA